MIINNLNVNYIFEPVANAPTVLFLHGWGAPFEIYKPLLDYIRAKGYGIAAFDCPGVGKTQEPLSPLTLDDYVSFTLEFCRNIGLDSAVLFAHSNGGRIALRLMSDKDCPLSVTRAVLMDAAGAPSPKTFRQKTSLRLYKCLRVLGTAPLLRSLFSELYETVRDKRSSADYRAASPVMKKTMSNLLSVDLTPVMPAIDADVLLVWGENDTATPLSEGKKMESLIKNSGLAPIAGAGHYPYIDNPRQFYAVLDAYL
ncbi:MAG: alpha/beta hydrolase [Clostridia bacterium]|nr:alpha/beta hydrolase [Clostridia bacterium]MBR5903841.1 alpha/beta hydrolase [Clostridia bacterium]